MIGGLFWEHFDRLISIFINKNVTVAEMNRLGCSLVGGGWDWRKRLFVWEEELWKDCCVLLVNIV